MIEKEHSAQKWIPNLLLGIFLGLFVQAIGAQALFRLGISMSPFHWVLFPVGFLLSFLISDASGRRFSFVFLLVMLFSIWGCSLVLKHLYALNWDGMLLHKEYLMAVSEGWNVYEDRFFEERLPVDEWENEVFYEKLAWGGFSVRYGYVYEAVLGNAIASIEGSKAVRLLMFIIPFLVALDLMNTYQIQGKMKLLIPLVVAFNPVSIVQFIGFWQDIYFSCFSSAAVLIAIRLSRCFDWRILFLFLLNLMLLVGVKRSGIAFAFALVPFAVLSFFIGQKLHLKWVLGVLLFSSVSLVFVLLTGKKMGIWVSDGLLPYGISEILEVSNISHYYDGEFLKKTPLLSCLRGPFQLILCALSPASMVPVDVSLTFPFWVTLDEFSVYCHAFTAPWLGGWGPFFGVSLCGILVFRVFHQRFFSLESIVPLLWVLFLSGILFIMPAFAPRWIPFAWLFPVLIYLSFGKNMSTQSHFVFALNCRTGFWRFMGGCSVCLLLINSVFLLSANFSGHLNSSAILKEQIDFIKNNFEEPLIVEFNDFTSNREWFSSEGIRFRVTNNLSDDASFLTLHRTNTHIDISGLDLDKPIVVRGNEWRSAREWADSINQKNGSLNPNWSNWIKPVITVK